MNNLKRIFISTLVFILPLFFLPFTQEYFITNKIYLLAFAGLILLLIATVEFFIRRKIVWQRSPFDLALSFILISLVLSIIIASPNKIEALFNPYYGFVAFFSLLILYFVLVQTTSKKNALNYFHILQATGLILAVIAIIFFFNPLKNVSLPLQLQWLKFSTFSPLGNQLDLAIFLGFILVLSVMFIWTRRKQAKSLNYSVVFAAAVGIIIAVYNIFRPENAQQNLLLTPLRQSWFATLEILKNPMTALFGVGVNNFSAVFSQVKDVFYNQTVYWQVSSFNLSRSALLHIFTETGLLGLATFVFLFYILWIELNKIAKDNLLRKSLFATSAYVVLVLLLFPPSFISFFLLIFLLFLIASESRSEYELEKAIQEVNFSAILPLYLILGVVFVVLILGSGYLLGRTYLAEYSYKQSLNEYLKNNLIGVYNNQRQAVILDPYVERFHTSFSQTNLLIANNVVANKKKLTDQEKQTAVQAIQASINEAKSAVALNPQKATNWENLAVVYRSIFNAVQGSDAWAISSYQRAIALDPINPIYRLNLGGIYYSQQKYNDAVISFEQALTLKPDWANAHYNLAWADYQAKNYQAAVSEMQNVLKLINRQQNPNDYKKANGELEQFKKQLPKQGGQQNAQPNSNLQLPSGQQQPQISPKLELPKSSSPEAK